MFAHDIGIRRYAERATTSPAGLTSTWGGHFAALEEPTLLVNHVREFFQHHR